MRLNAYMNGILVGRLVKQNNGAMSFTYDDSWLTHPACRPLSLSLPLHPSRHEGNRVFDFFDNLLPDAKIIRDRIQARLKVSSSHPFDILKAIGRDCIGAIQLCPPDIKPNDLTVHATPLTDHEIATTLKQFEMLPLGMMRDEEDFRISLAGAQEKMAFLYWNAQWQKPFGNTPTTHIFKLPIGQLTQHSIDLSQSCENEWLCLLIAKSMGFNVPEAEIKYFEDQKVLVVERFDREVVTSKQTILRLPTEDFCQSLGISSQNKYENDGGPGIVECMKLLQGSEDSVKDRETFFKAQILFWLLAAIDGHAKNFSLYLQRNGYYRMTPLYDIMSAYPLFETQSIQKQKAKMAMALRGRNAQYHWSMIQPRHFLSTGKMCGLDENKVTELLSEIAAKAMETCRKLPTNLPKDFPKNVSQPIFEGMRKKTESVLRFLEKQ